MPSDLSPSPVTRSTPAVILQAAETVERLWEEPRPEGAGGRWITYGPG
jgi:hypothetical protein